MDRLHHVYSWVSPSRVSEKLEIHSLTISLKYPSRLSCDQKPWPIKNFIKWAFIGVVKARKKNLYDFRGRLGYQKLFPFQDNSLRPPLLNKTNRALHHIIFRVSYWCPGPDLNWLDLNGRETFRVKGQCEWWCQKREICISKKIPVRPRPRGWCCESLRTRPVLQTDCSLPAKYQQSFLKFPWSPWPQAKKSVKAVFLEQINTILGFSGSAEDKTAPPASRGAPEEQVEPESIPTLPMLG